jgi:hypothetical protein
MWDKLASTLEIKCCLLLSKNNLTKIGVHRANQWIFPLFSLIKALTVDLLIVSSRSTATPTAQRLYSVAATGSTTNRKA